MAKLMFSRYYLHGCIKLAVELSRLSNHYLKYPLPHTETKKINLVICLKFKQNQCNSCKIQMLHHIN